MVRQKLYAIINILGLTIGLSCFILIFLFVRHEHSYDQFYPAYNQIFRVYQQKPGDDFLGKNFMARTPAGLATTLTSEFAEVLHATTLENLTTLIGHQKNNFYEDGILADEHFFDVFPHTFINGDLQRALESPESIVLTASLAKKIFGDEDPLHQSLLDEHGHAYTVTGVIADLPANSSLQFSFIRSILAWPDYVRDQHFADRWMSNSAYTFFRLEKGASAANLEAKLPAMLEKYQGSDHNFPFEIHYYVQPLAELHFENKTSEDIGLKGNSGYVFLFAVIAILVLLLACANYMNLAIARLSGRVKEVGMRKTIGASRRQLAIQFLGESILSAFFSLLLALALTYYAAPVFSTFFERPIELNLVNDPWLWPGLLLLVVIVGLFSGSYPAFFLSALRPVVALNGKYNQLTGVKLYRWLMIGQYTLSIALLASSIIIYNQFQFIQNKALGYEKNHIVSIPIRDHSLHQKMDLLKRECEAHPGIVLATASSSLPTNVDARRKINYDYEMGGDQADALDIYRVRVDENFLSVFGIDLLAGRNFRPGKASDLENGRIINETAAKALSWSAAEAVGKQFDDIGGMRTVIGVIRDIHMHSMHQEIEPLMLTPHEQYQGFLSVKVRPDNLTQTLTFLEDRFKSLTDYPFEYQFLDDHFDHLYKADRKLGETFGIFTLLSILIASLGVFGLAAYFASQRTKEIGIRKVLGASVGRIFGLLSGDILKMVLIGFALAIPIAWFGMNRWLQGFAYHADIQWWVFPVAGLASILMAIFSVSSQSLKAAWVNPVDSLKNQ